MATRLGQCIRGLALTWAVIALSVVLAVPALAAPFAALVMDARSGEVLYEKNADTRLHPASLTKMMTLYIAFEAIERGEISLDKRVKISKNAASEPPSRLGLKAGQSIALRYLIRAAAVKSANDAATAIGEAISGSETAFAKRMNRTAKALGMRNTTFKNANGLTASGHLSTARDMTILGRRLFYDFPQYYNIFSRVTTDAGMAKVYNTNRRFLSSYKGADGIKTGYTNAAGFNLTASAERGRKRIIATVFGGSSTAQRNAKMAELLDLGFGAARNNVKENKPAPPSYGEPSEELLVANVETSAATIGGAGKTIRLVTTLKTSPRPKARPAADALPEETLVAMQDGISDALAEVAGAAPAARPEPKPQTDLAAAETPPPPQTLEAQALDLAAPQAEAVALAELPAGAEAETGMDEPAADLLAEATAAAVEAALAEAVAAAPEAAETANENETVALADAGLAGIRPAPRPQTQMAIAPAEDTQLAALPEPAEVPQETGETLAVAEAAETAAQPDDLVLASVSPTSAVLLPTTPAPSEPVVVTRISTSGGRHWGISVGRFTTRDGAERALLKTALADSVALGDSLRKVMERSGGFDANFVGMSQEQADLACRRLAARQISCAAFGP